MFATALSFLILLVPMAQQAEKLLFEIRADKRLLLGKGQTSGHDYYDVVVTRQPTSGVLVKLDFSRRDTKFSFDLHHRLSLDPEFGLPAEVITNIEVLSGGTTSMGTFTISDIIRPGAVFEEMIEKVSKAEVDRYVTPLGRKTITLNTIPGSQSLSIVGQSVMIKRGTRTVRIDTPGQRIAVVSNFKFEENRPGNLLTLD